MAKIQDQAPSLMTWSHCPNGKNHPISRYEFQCTNSNRFVSHRYDFYLVPQKVNQGTVAPTNYNVIYDEMELQPDKMQLLTYKLSHLYVSFYIRLAMLNDWNFPFLFLIAIYSTIGAAQFVCRQFADTQPNWPSLSHRFCTRFRTIR